MARGARPRAGDFPPWLTVDDYKAFARITDSTDDAAISGNVAAAMSVLELRAPYAFVFEPDTDPPVPVPVPDDVHQAGLLLVNRLMARRNSPDGVVGVSDMGTARIASYDADINMLVSAWTESVVA